MMDGGDGGQGAAVADLFFGFAAILIVILCLLSQNLRTGLAAEAEEDRLTATAAVEGIWLALARADGVDLARPGTTPRFVPLDRVIGPETATWAKDAPARPWVVITPEATDSAFLLETALAANGLAAMRRVRLDGPCPAPRFTEKGLACGRR